MRLVTLIIVPSLLCSHCAPESHDRDAAFADINQPNPLTGDWQSTQGAVLTWPTIISLHLGADGTATYTEVGWAGCNGTRTNSALTWTWQPDPSPYPRTLSISGTAVCSGSLYCACPAAGCTPTLQGCSSTEIHKDWSCSAALSSTSLNILNTGRCSGAGLDPDFSFRFFTRVLH